MAYDEIDKLLPDYASVSIAEAGYNIDFYDGGSKYVSTAQFADIDQRLPAGLRTLCLLSEYGTASTQEVHSLLKLWYAPLYLEDNRGLLAGIYDLYSVEISDAVVDVYCNGRRYEDVSVDGLSEKLKIPIGTIVFEVKLDPNKLDAECPAWRERFEMAQSLDLTLLDSVKFMMQPKATLPTTVLDDLTL